LEERFLGRQQELILLETVPQLQQKKAVLKFSIKIVVLQVVQLALKPMVRGQLLETVFKENVLGHALGRQFRQTIQLTVQQQLQKSMEPNLNTLRVVLQVVR
jgi:hypothetical protein